MASIQPVVNRMSGMASGMDTEAMVKAMTQANQLKMDKIGQAKQVAEWRKTAYTDFNNSLRSFKDDYTSLLGSKSMMKSDTYRTMNVDKTSSSASIKALSGANLGQHTLEVTQIATGATATGTQLTTTGRLANTNVTLKDLAGHASIANAFEPDMLEDAEGQPLFNADGERAMGYSFKINGTSFTFKETDKLSDVMSQINSSKAGAKLTYSQLTNSFSLSATKTGAASELLVEDESGNMFTGLGLNGTEPGTSVYSAKAGQNALIKIDGVEMEQTSNSFTVENMAITLTSATTTPYEFNVTRDVSKSVDMVKDFVKSFNDLVSKLDEAYREKKNTKFSPLTDEVKKSMSEEEVKTWEGKAKEGLLNRDSGLASIVNELRAIATTNVPGLGQLKDVGIKVGQYVPGMPFQLEIDEEKLKETLDNDPDHIYNLMTKAAVKGTSETPGEAGGIIARMNTAMDKFSANTKANLIPALTTNIDDYSKRIGEQTDKMYEMQDRLYKKFASFESAMAKMQSQQTSMAGMFPS